MVLITLAIAIFIIFYVTNEQIIPYDSVVGTDMSDNILSIMKRLFYLFSSFNVYYQ